MTKCLGLILLSLAIGKLAIAETSAYDPSLVGVWRVIGQSTNDEYLKLDVWRGRFGVYTAYFRHCQSKESKECEKAEETGHWSTRGGFYYKKGPSYKSAYTVYKYSPVGEECFDFVPVDHPEEGGLRDTFSYRECLIKR